MANGGVVPEEPVLLVVAEPVPPAAPVPDALPDPEPVVVGAELAVPELETG